MLSLFALSDIIALKGIGLPSWSKVILLNVIPSFGQKSSEYDAIFIKSPLFTAACICCSLTESSEPDEFFRHFVNKSNAVLNLTESNLL